jgi:hypothetical protein
LKRGKDPTSVVVVDSLVILVIFKVASLEVEVEVKFKRLVVLVKTAVVFPNTVFKIWRRTMPGVIDAVPVSAPVLEALELVLSTLDPGLGAAVDVGRVCNVLPKDVDRASGVELRLIDSTERLLAGELEAAMLDLELGVDDITANDEVRSTDDDGDGVRSAENDDGERSAEDDGGIRSADEELCPTAALTAAEGQIVLVAVTVDVTVVVVVV